MKDKKYRTDSTMYICHPPELKSGKGVVVCHRSPDQTTRHEHVRGAVASDEYVVVFGLKYDGLAY